MQCAIPPPEDGWEQRHYLHWSFLSCGVCFADPRHFSSGGPDLYPTNFQPACFVTYLPHYQKVSSPRAGYSRNNVLPLVLHLFSVIVYHKINLFWCHSTAKFHWSTTYSMLLTPTASKCKHKFLVTQHSFPPTIFWSLNGSIVPLWSCFPDHKRQPASVSSLAYTCPEDLLTSWSPQSFSIFLVLSQMCKSHQIFGMKYSRC